MGAAQTAAIEALKVWARDWMESMVQRINGAAKNPHVQVDDYRVSLASGYKPTHLQNGLRAAAEFR